MFVIQQVAPYSGLVPIGDLKLGARSLKHSDPRSDDALIQAANGGDEAAFEAIYYRYRNWVHNLAWRFTGRHDETLDVLQETFTYLLTKFPGFRLSASMTTFLYPVVKHLAIAARRKRQRYGAGDEPLNGLPAKPPANDPVATRAELADVLARLPAGQREVLLMRFVDGMTIEETARALNLPPGTVKSRIHNALQKLRTDPKTKDYFQR